MTAVALGGPRSQVGFFEAPASWIESAYRGVTSWFAYSPPPLWIPELGAGIPDTVIFVASTGEFSFSDDEGLRADTPDLALFEVAHSRAAALEVIDGFAGLPPAWGGPDTVLPPLETRGAAKALLVGLPSSILTPHLSPSADGEVGFTWASATKRVDALLDVEGNLVWFWTEDGKIEPGGEAAYDGSFPDEMLNILKSL